MGQIKNIKLHIVTDIKMASEIETKIAEAQKIGKLFAEHFYNTFDTQRDQLEGIYIDCSLLTFENETFFGKASIMQKLKSLSFSAVKHVTTTVDGQPTIDGGVLVHVLGQLKTDNDNPHTFSETFHLKPQGQSFVVLNDFFRLGIHNGWERANYGD